MTTKNFKVIRASAGTGKTYTLVKEYLQLALKNGTNWYYKHILAITFTNAAAAEMKERILKNLRLFSQNDHQSALLTEVAKNLDLTEVEVRDRARRTFHHMLHNYGQLSILTIDSFTSKLIRSFSKDLHLKYDFNIEIDSSTFLEKVVDECISLIGEDEALTNWLVDYAKRNAEDEADWNFKEKVLKTSKEMIRESAWPSLDKLSAFSDEDFRRVANEVNKAISQFEHKAISIAQKGLDVIAEAQLSLFDFAYGKSGGLMYLKKIGVDQNYVTASHRTLELLVDDDKWYNQKTERDLVARIKQIQPPVRECLQELINFLNEEAILKYRIRKAIAKNIYSIGLINKLSSIAAQIRIDENIILIADFHRMVNDIVRSNQAPFIFERIGVRYRHIMIDEFQDTSILQWENALPLIDNALAENHLNLIVGDAKQAIYRWRGGDARQFVELPVLRSESSQQITSLPYHFHRENLSTSYRSAEAIVEFNNMLYKRLTESQPHLHAVYDGFEQTTSAARKGMVSVHYAQGSKRAEYRPVTMEIILKCIAESLADGYQPGDIAVLTRIGKGEADEVASALLNAGYQVVTKESLLADHSPAVNVVISYLNMMFNLSDKFAPTLLLQSLCKLHPQISLTEFHEKYAVGSGKKLSFDHWRFLNDYFGDMGKITLTTPPLEAVISVIRMFKIEPDSGLELLLEKVRTHCVEDHRTITEFLTWWKDQSEKTYTSSVGSSGAIQIMTVHKSKGLEFPVVIYARMTRRKTPDEIWINLDEKEYGLPATLISSSMKSAEDSEQTEFNNESEQQAIDEMNVCYVATTRPKDRLYMILEGGSQSALTKQIQSTIQKISPNFPETPYVFGVKEKNNREPEDDNTMLIPFENAPARTWQIRSKTGPQNKAALYGDLLHRCLQLIITARDIPAAIANVIKNSMHQHLESQIKTDIEKIILHPMASTWFQGIGRLLQERELVTSSGKILRPDRVLIFEGYVDVIDYKTGQPSEQHFAQLKSYMHEISQIEKIPAKGYVVYTSSGEIVKVE